MKTIKKKITGNYELGERVTSLYAAYLEIDEDKAVHIFDENDCPENHFNVFAKIEITHPDIQLGNSDEWRGCYFNLFKKSLLEEGLCEDNAAGTLFALDTEDIERKRIGRRIAELRIAASLSQAELARRVNTKQNCISRIEKGRFNPGFDTLQSIADVFGMKIDFIK